MSWFYIYHYKGKGLATEIARTRYLADAQTVLSKWDSGYIACDGSIIERKNMDI